MKSKLSLLVLSVLTGALLLSACGGAATEVPAYYDYEAPAATEAAAFDSFAGAPAEAEAPVAQDYVEKSEGDPGGVVFNISGEPASYAANSMIIKNADIRLQVDDTDVAIDRAIQAIGDLGGYIISSRVWYQDYYDGIENKNYKYATITVGIPVDQFERMLTRLRGLAVKVIDETASGEDVSDQYVDLQSQLTNLEATRDRIKSFLEDAKTVDEALRINQELSNVESQIEAIKGQMNYLKDRSSFSTITINLEPVLPEVKPQPTPTPKPWNPGETFEDSKETLISAYQGIIELAIWFGVACLPIAGPPALLLWILWKFFSKRKPNKTAG
jgi:enamine deaminase RidA (YjgF/YER057c/UK114 family)